MNRPTLIAITGMLLAAFWLPAAPTAATRELPPQMVPDPDAPLDPALAGDMNASGEMNRRSGAGCQAVFDGRSGRRIYICAVQSSADCVPLTDPGFAGFPGAKYKWACPAPNRRP